MIKEYVCNECLLSESEGVIFSTISKTYCDKCKKEKVKKIKKRYKLQPINERKREYPDTW